MRAGRNCFFVRATVVAIAALTALADVALGARVHYLLEGHEVLYHEFPAYPARAVDLQWQGRGMLRLHVRSDGRVASVTVLKSTGYERLDMAARKAFLRWRFQPEKTAFAADVPCDFSLRRGSSSHVIASPTAPPKRPNEAMQRTAR